MGECMGVHRFITILQRVQPRQTTLLIYLNENWGKDSGGELELLPFLSAPECLSPVFDRGVLLLSDRVLHRSLPPKDSGITKARWLLTVWFDGARVDQPRGSRFPPLLQRLLAPAVYKAEFLEALEHSMPPGKGKDVLVRAQLEEINAVEDDNELKEMLHQLREAAS